MSDLITIRGSMVKLAREARGCSITKLSQEIGVTAKVLREWERSWLDGVEVDESVPRLLSDALGFTEKFYTRILEPWPVVAICVGPREGARVCKRNDPH